MSIVDYICVSLQSPSKPTELVFGLDGIRFKQTTINNYEVHFSGTIAEYNLGKATNINGSLRFFEINNSLLEFMKYEFIFEKFILLSRFVESLDWEKIRDTDCYEYASMELTKFRYWNRIENNY